MQVTRCDQCGEDAPPRKVSFDGTGPQQYEAVIEKRVLRFEVKTGQIDDLGSAIDLCRSCLVKMFFGDLNQPGIGPKLPEDPAEPVVRIIQENGKTFIISASTYDAMRADAEKWRALPMGDTDLAPINRADANLGALVRQMTDGLYLVRHGDNWTCETKHGTKLIGIGACDSPEEALRSTLEMSASK